MPGHSFAARHTLQRFGWILLGALGVVLVGFTVHWSLVEATSFLGNFLWEFGLYHWALPYLGAWLGLSALLISGLPSLLMGWVMRD